MTSGSGPGRYSPSCCWPMRSTGRRPRPTRLLEIMQETRVTIDGVSYPIEPPFLVLATQNPIESEGTYNLPEAQLDRFLFKLVVDYPSEREEVDILRLHTRGVPPDRNLGEQLAAVTDPAEVLGMQRRCASVLVDDRVLGYIAALVRATRRWPAFSLGVSPRAGVAILRGARAVAALEGRRIHDSGRRSGGRPARAAAPGHVDPRGRDRGPVARRALDRADPLGRGAPTMSVPRIWPGLARPAPSCCRHCFRSGSS